MPEGCAACYSFPMSHRVIRVCIGKEPELYEELIAATTNHTLYEGCFIMQYSEHRGYEGEMIGEFTLRQAREDEL
jgi:hypothetical protein